MKMALVVGAASLAVTGCGGLTLEEREQFVGELIESALNDTDFHRQYVSAEDATEFRELRHLLSEDFIVVESDAVWGQFEYSVIFGADETKRAEVSLFEKDGEIYHANLSVYRD